MRWAKILRELGHRVVVSQEYLRGRCDLLIALHARRSAESVSRFRSKRSEGSIILALTGTDLYRDIHSDESARQSMETATRLVLLQSEGLSELPEAMRANARVIHQSVSMPSAAEETRPREFHSGTSRAREFRVCVLGHLRIEKDPFLTAEAARLLPTGSRIRILHVGAALTGEMAERALHEEQINPRYRWLGELPRWKALRVLARSHLMALTSVMEGGANAISESLAASVPIVASQIPGTVGLLGPGYPGYFPVGRSDALADLLRRAETDPEFYAELEDRCRAKAWIADPELERQAWQALLEEVSGESAQT